MNSEKKLCNFSLLKGDAEYLYAFLETIPDNYWDRKMHMRVKRAIETELQRHQLDWIANQEEN